MIKLQGWINITHPDEIKETFEVALKISGFDVLGFIEHHFKPFGYTALYLLSESHFALHTFPENGNTYIDLSSCVEKQYNNFISILEENGIIISDKPGLVIK